ncbi:hypothetical protein EUTSA_v10019694mg [Eutrema salsugineum]|uniref:Uncharacterized protein n=1 Tax=Eutrema salsugineum TaxID=72664 RepID=V4KFN8_EUTSA|nr:uncharacterized protein LOC18008778 [Eutrema salsugineum]ESQ28632.1 hypothetical protein EUTSA_v10019694mg [Eutrema salsugineum]
MASSSYPPSLTTSPLYVARKAKEILATHDVTEITKLVTTLGFAKETEDQSSDLLYKSFKKHFPNLLAVKLLQVYRFPESKTMVRSHSLSLLDSLLIDLEDSRIRLKTEALHDIKELLNSCLVQQEISDLDSKPLSRIISCVEKL